MFERQRQPPEHRPLHCSYIGRTLSEFHSPDNNRDVFGKQFTVIQKIAAHDFGDAENNVTVGDLLENFAAEPFTILDDPFLMT